MRTGPAPPIIDAHQHLWDLDRLRLPWVQPGSPLYRNFTLADYARAADGLGILRTVYMEVDVAPEQQGEEAAFVTSVAGSATPPLVAAVVSGRPADEGFPAWLDRLATMPIVRGIRQVLHVAETPPGFCLDPDFIAGVRLLGERDLSFDICIRCAELPDAGQLIDACPETQFILDHCGNPSLQAIDLTAWRRDIGALAMRTNITCKVSGLVNTAKPGGWGPETLAPIVDHVFDTFGPDRVLFGGDWPVCTRTATLREWVTALRQVVASRPAEVQTKLFADNAARIYRLDP